MTVEKRRDWRKALTEVSPTEEELRHMPPWRRTLWRLIEEARVELEEEKPLRHEKCTK